MIAGLDPRFWWWVTRAADKSKKSHQTLLGGSVPRSTLPRAGDLSYCAPIIIFCSLEGSWKIGNGARPRSRGLIESRIKFVG